MIKFEHVTVQFAGLTAVQDLSFEVPEGAIYSLIGPNGAGKTTVFNCISRFYTPVRGRILFGGEDLLTWKPHQVIRKGIARSFQNVELFSKMSVLDNLRIGLHSTYKRNIFSIALNLPSVRRTEAELVRRVHEVMELVGIRQLAHEFPANLPFGYQKMVDIARALIARPKLLLLDEPVAGMNQTETNQIGELIRRIKREMNITVLLIEHNMSMVMNISDFITVMNFGQKIAEGRPEEIQQHPEVIRAYLGEVSSDAQVV